MTQKTNKTKKQRSAHEGYLREEPKRVTLGKGLKGHLRRRPRGLAWRVTSEKGLRVTSEEGYLREGSQEGHLREGLRRVTQRRAWRITSEEESGRVFSEYGPRRATSEKGRRLTLEKNPRRVTSEIDPGGSPQRRAWRFTTEKGLEGHFRKGP